jgi:hypothetical protein
VLKVEIPADYTLLIPSESVIMEYRHSLVRGYQTIRLPCTNKWFVGLLLKSTVPLTDVYFTDVNMQPIHRWPLIPASNHHIYLPTHELPNLSQTAWYSLQINVPNTADETAMVDTAFVSIDDPEPDTPVNRRWYGRRP